MGDEQSVMMASSIGTLPSMAMQRNSSLDPFKAYAVELRKKHSADLQDIVESSLKRYDSDEVDAFVEDIINEVSSCMTTWILPSPPEMYGCPVQYALLPFPFRLPGAKHRNQT